MPHFIAKINDKFCVLKTYEDKYNFSRIIEECDTMKEAIKLYEEVTSGGDAPSIPANNVGANKIAGLNLGYGVRKRIQRRIRARNRKYGNYNNNS